MSPVRTFDDLVAEAESADVTGWGFGWLEGRATEQRPSWRCSRVLAARLAQVRSVLDIDTGSGEVASEAPALPDECASPRRGHPTPNGRMRCRSARPRGSRDRAGRVPAFPRRVVRPGDGAAPSEVRLVRDPARARARRHYFAQHVGPASAFELIEFFLGPLPEHREGRDPEREAAQAQEAGLTVTDLCGSPPDGVLRRRRCRLDPARVCLVGSGVLGRPVPRQAPGASPRMTVTRQAAVPGGAQRSREEFDAGSGGGFEGDVVAEGFEASDVAAFLRGGRDAAVVVISAEVLKPGVRVGQQMPDDHEDGPSDGDGGSARKSARRVLRALCRRWSPPLLTLSAQHLC